MQPNRRDRAPLGILLTSALAVAVVLCGCDDASVRAEAPSNQAPSNQGRSGTDVAADGREAYDWLISGGTVIDGTGAPGSRADVLIQDDRIAWVAEVDPDTIDAANHHDASGRVVAPGFIDLHAHGNPTGSTSFDAFLAQGVTTVVLGQDGSSPRASAIDTSLEEVDRAAPAVNVGYLVGHNTIRGESGVGFGAPDDEAVARMASLVETALAAGAFGLSLGLEYDPGGRADIRELSALAEPVARRDGVVASHLRSEDADRIEASVEELLEQGRRSGARVHVSHIKIVLGDDPGQAGRILGRMASARAEGVHVTGDVYPYTASFTGLSILFPEWARPPNDYARAVAERREELADHLRQRVESRNGPDATLFGTGTWSGQTLAEAAAQRGVPYEEILIELGPGGASAAYFVMDETVMETFLADPHVAVASDGSPTMRHPRGHGSFARVIRRHAVEDDLLSLEEAVRKMTTLPASILGVDDAERVEVRRGRLAEGWAADLVVFDPGAVEDHADFEAPRRLASGVDGVWVNGRISWEAGARAGGSGAGQALRDGRIVSNRDSSTGSAF